ncbi:hypothetical protein BIY26_06555 [Brenneria goodwinii]|uniref:Uncharacterized protein n=1 Tax=Brenneria goodwinii TaxID=1109412 RepID=A0A0G4JV51_9GAMM|nr:hypothetical protein AWC36_21860 [Brenneria goodwinii]RLM27137.1 hypothetical protein BIY26_06555 [Brenneria goodwinii]CPR16758.1 hypothetical protein BN1221_02260 [Brenneria goodwinii]
MNRRHICHQRLNSVFAIVAIVRFLSQLTIPAGAHLHYSQGVSARSAMPGRREIYGAEFGRAGKNEWR